METPAPVNLNALKNILAKSKAVMNAVEEKVPTKGSNKQRIVEEHTEDVRRPIYDERDEREPSYPTPTLSDYQPTMQPKMYTPEQVMASRLPQNIKEAMIKNPIPMLQGPPSSFTLEDVQDIVEKPVKKQITESVSRSNDMITISKTELKTMIGEAISQFFTQAYNKNLTEAAITQTIKTLIREGKIPGKLK